MAHAPARTRRGRDL